MKHLILLLPFLFFVGKNVKAQNAPDLSSLQKDLSIFNDKLATQLKKNVKKAAIEKIENNEIREAALEMFAKKYDFKYRLADYNAYLSPESLGKKLSIGNGYSQYENMTGIYLPLGKHVVLVENMADNKTINLVIPNWNRRPAEGVIPNKDPNGWGIKKVKYPLKNGINVIDVQDFDGLAYIDYYSETPEKENKLRIHFISGKINGYFDAGKQKNEDWNALLDNAVYPMLDARGKHIQTVYPKADLKKYAYNKGIELLDSYDTLVYRQYRIMGLIKYNEVPNNRILARVNYNYYMFRDQDGVAYMGGTAGYALGKVLDPKQVKSGDAAWGFCHEVGHVHQLRPYFNWGGLAEVSNNIFAMYVTRSLGGQSRLLKGNHYQLEKQKSIDKKISYLKAGGNFEMLVPFWQLQLYFEKAGKNPDFYPDLFEAFRKQADNFAKLKEKPERNPAVYQLNFVKTACEISKLDLTDFFDAYGFFNPDTFEIKSYGTYQFSMTQSMADECRKEIKAKNYPKPVLDITSLTD
ncbi:M60 family metallopeptidase [Pedobacter sp. MW01-1-1]|uniref:M60 family metallopeptidase n=1 Tax=Pedobacter sp. MW01-1-1 TaxID=3383027 RepID=UPI003FF0F07D